MRQIHKIPLILVIIIMVSGLNFTPIEEQEKHSFTLRDSPFIAQEGVYDKNTTEYTVTQRTRNIVNSSNFSDIGLWEAEPSGDLADIHQEISNGVANGTVVGEMGNFSLVNDPPQASDWSMMLNPRFPVYPRFPHNNVSGIPAAWIDQYGCFARHDWQEGAVQSPSVHWARNITMPVDMSDYVITSANVSAVVNASVSSNIDTELGEFGGYAPYNVEQFVTFDYVRFYILIADLNRENIYEIASNQTRWLGNDAMAYYDMVDTFLNTIPEEFLIFYLSSVLSKDNRNFTLILGMNIWCEDNVVITDWDTWNSLRIKSVSLNFSYEKRINQGSSMVWKQVVPKIEKSAQNVSVLSLKGSDFNFQYGLSRLWPASSPNSRIRVKVNGVLFKDVFELPLATTDMRSAFPTDNDITDILSTESATTIEITIMISDNFFLDQNISVYIDNVVLMVSYIEVVFHPPPPPPETPASEPPDNTQQYVIYGLLGMIGGFGVLSAMYLTTWRYPKTVREIRAMRKAMKKGKAHPMDSKAADILFTGAYVVQVGKGLSMPYVNKLKMKVQDSGKTKNAASGDVKPKVPPKPKAEPKQKLDVPKPPPKPKAIQKMPEPESPPATTSGSPNTLSATPEGPKITRPSDLLKKQSLNPSGDDSNSN
jgi:hypothetical protein